MPTNFTDDLRLAHVLADDADSLTTSRFKAQDLHVMNKPDLTPVTDADKSVEEGIRRTLSRARPRDAVVGEEQGSTGHSQRRLSCGAETQPTTTSSSTMSAIRVAHTGTPRTKFLVPSIGSSTHRRGPCPVVPNSSPMTASRVRARLRVIRSISSTARSASVTGVRSGLVSTVRSCALKRSRLMESA